MINIKDIQDLIDEQTRNGRDNIYISKIILEELNYKDLDISDYIYISKPDLELLLENYNSK